MREPGLAVTVILEPLVKFREMIFRRARKGKTSAWWADMIRGMSLVDMAIHGRIGLWCHPIETLYEGTLREMIDKK